MFTNNYKPLRNLVLIAGLGYVFHKIVFFGLSINDDGFHYSLEMLYLVFLAFSVIVLLVLLKVKEKSFDNVGMSFLLATSVKIIPCYLIMRQILQVSSQNNSIEKINFFAVFILFLTIETVLTIRLVNETQ